jgi:hypothetical protein
MATLEIPEALATLGLHVIPGNGQRRRAADRGIVHAKSQEGLLTWSYTTTLSATLDHPEILVAGLDPFLANSVMTHLVEMISHGGLYEDGSTTEGALHQLTCVFKRMAPTAAAILMPTLGAKPALQLIYPDHRNRLPWDAGHNPSWREVQPLFLADQPLGEIESSFLNAAMHRPLLGDRRHPGQPGLLVKIPR